MNASNQNSDPFDPYPVLPIFLGYFCLGIYVLWLINSPKTGLESLAHYLMATLTMGSAAFVFGVIGMAKSIKSLQNGYERAMTPLMLSLIPMLCPVMLILYYIFIPLFLRK